MIVDDDHIEGEEEDEKGKEKGHEDKSYFTIGGSTSH